MKPSIKTILLLATAALLSVACGPASKTMTYQQTDTNQENVLQALSAKADRAAVDSLYYTFRSLQTEMTELKETFAETVPQAQAQVTIPVQSLIDLPDGAKYGTTEGRATVEVQRQGDTYIATSRCDSVARQCARYERQVSRQQNTIDSLNSAVATLNSRLSQMALESHSNATKTTFSATETKAPPLRGGRWLAAGAALGVAGSIGVQALWKRFSVGSVIKNIFGRIFTSFR